jgi:hypothetical protein
VKKSISSKRGRNEETHLQQARTERTHLSEIGQPCQKRDRRQTRAGQSGFACAAASFANVSPSCLPAKIRRVGEQRDAAAAATVAELRTERAER